MMKKRLFALIGCLGICLLTDAKAVSDMNNNVKEVNVSGGVKAGAVFLNFLKEAAPGAVSGINPGGSVGGFVLIDFTETWGLRPELNLNYKQNDCTGTRYPCWVAKTFPSLIIIAATTSIVFMS